MKLRIKGNSIRLRLNRSEITKFGEQGFIEEMTVFPGGGKFEYAIERKQGISGLEAGFSGNRITVFVPDSMVDEWVGTEIVGFDTKAEPGHAGDLFLLIEKDWVCLDNSFEDQSDNFPNPNTVC